MKYLVTAENNIGEMTYQELWPDWKGVEASLKEVIAEGLDLNSVTVWRKCNTVISATIEETDA